MIRSFSTSCFAALTALALLAAVLCAGCNRQPKSTPRDFSQASSVSIVLGEPDQEHGKGITHAYWEQDGLTMATNLLCVRPTTIFVRRVSVTRLDERPEPSPQRLPSQGRPLGP